jgi:TetR/AcrR family transcriptional repressor for divergent bdcA
MSTAPRQRRPAFDREAGVATAQALFHARGYDAVSVADLTEALDIKPPSFYAAYGSKAELFERTMLRYATEHALPLDKILAPGRPPAEALSALLVAAAKEYGHHASQRGCLVTEGMRADDPVARRMACTLAGGGIQAIRAYIESVHPESAEHLTDYVVVSLRGLSSAACVGMSKARLVNVAQTAGKAFGPMFEPD